VLRHTANLQNARIRLVLIRGVSVVKQHTLLRNMLYSDNETTFHCFTVQFDSLSFIQTN